jgi:hypothetical protein
MNKYWLPDKIPTNVNVSQQVKEFKQSLESQQWAAFLENKKTYGSLF